MQVFLVLEVIVSSHTNLANKKQDFFSPTLADIQGLEFTFRFQTHFSLLADLLSTANHENAQSSMEMTRSET